MEQAVQPVPRRVVEEDAELGGRPHHDLARPGHRRPDLQRVDGLPAGLFPGLLQGAFVLSRPGGHALHRPDQALGPLGRLELDQLGHVLRHQALALGVAQRRTQGRPDALLGRRTGDALTAHRGADRGILRRLGRQQFGVLVVDAGEQRVEVGDPQPVHPDVVEDVQVDPVV
ncbi:hypothetical protein AB0D67_17265 [Streptosporangium sp. NPDC048047]|uniref:hypothetical protein n=1 Tax=Streptosporangium sp. NPDC048047 TaxID=3155748 RepID=UPI00343617D1